MDGVDRCVQSLFLHLQPKKQDISSLDCFKQGSSVTLLIMAHPPLLSASAPTTPGDQTLDH